MDSHEKSSDGRSMEVAALRERVTQLESELGESRLRENQLRQILDLVPEFIYCFDEDGRILLANEPLAHAFGTSVDEICGRLITDVDPDAAQAQQTLENCREAIRRNMPSHVPERELTDVHGNRLVVQSSSIPYRRSDTGKPAILGVSVNLTERVQFQQELMKSRHAVIFGLARLAESRDDDTGKHLERICRFVMILAKQMAQSSPDIDAHWVHTVGITAALHDIGKVGIPDAILLKPGKLTDEEWKIMQKHTFIGGDTLLDIKNRWEDDVFLVTATEIALSHHEKWDGSGYPLGLVGENIPLSARLVAVADVYDALTSKRVYKPALSHEQARQIIAEAVGTHFDPDVVDAFSDVESEFHRVARDLHATAAPEQLDRR